MVQIHINLLLDRSRSDTLTAQLVSQLRDAIRVGRIAPGVRLPSSRRLADQLGIGRNTVVRAYETLEMESLVEARPASGIFAMRPPGGKLLANPAPLTAAAGPAPAAARGRLSYDFAPGRPNAALFPMKTWRRALQTCLSQGGGVSLTQPGDLFGLASLRSAIASHLAAARGIIVDPGQVIVTSGVTEAIALVARLFVAPGTQVCVERPCPLPAVEAFRAEGGVPCPVPVDEDGLVVGDLPPGPVSLAYVTPSHQYPTGHTMSPPRREQLASWSRAADRIILEDDRGVDFGYEGGHPPAVAAYAPERTIYCADFAQSLGHGLGLGYMVAPAALVDRLRAAKALLNSGISWMAQAAAAELIRAGSYASHVMRMRLEYRQRRDHLISALRRNFGDVDISGQAGGLHVFWQLPPGVPDATTVEALGRRARVGVYSLASGGVHDQRGGLLARRALMLGYAALSPRQIEHGIARLSDAIDDALDGRTIGLGDLLLHRPVMSRAVSRASAGPGVRPGKPAPRFSQKPALSDVDASRALSGGSQQRENGMPTPAVTGLYQYPIKGLSPQPVRSAVISAGQPFPFDRVFALARPGTAVTAEDPKWAKKGLFVMLMLDEALARVKTELSPDTLTLTVQDTGREVLAANLADPASHPEVEAFFHRLAPKLPAPPVLVRARAGHFMDKPDNVISLINLATVRALERQWGFAIDPLRFRANIYVDNVAPWEEFDWVGHDIRIGGCAFHVDRRNGRCSATNVDPATGRRDLDIPGGLRKAFGHKDLGVYLVARSDGVLSAGDRLDTPRAAPPRSAVVPPPPPAEPAGAYICRGCYFIYVEAKGHPASGIAPGTRFADLPRHWPCPDCGTSTDMFRPHTVFP